MPGSAFFFCDVVGAALLKSANYLSCIFFATVYGRCFFNALQMVDRGKLHFQDIIYQVTRANRFFSAFYLLFICFCFAFKKRFVNILLFKSTGQNHSDSIAFLDCETAAHYRHLLFC